MIPKAHITEWRSHAPWTEDAWVEQDLVISRAIVGIFGAAGIAERLAERSIPKCKTTSLPRSASTSRVSLPGMPPPRRGSR